jgi:hypothetical protein
MPFERAVPRILARGPDRAILVPAMFTGWNGILDIRRRFRTVRDMRTAAIGSAIETVGNPNLEPGASP